MGATVLVEYFFPRGGLGQILYRGLYNGQVAEAALIWATVLGVGIYLAGDLIGAALHREWRKS
jgi:hypothetical protein